MAKQAQWQWQTEGTSWKGVGIYHVTLTLTSRQPLLGTLVIPDNNPAQAWVQQTELGKAVLAYQRSVPMFHPEIQILQYCLMPDHLHAIWYVRLNPQRLATKRLMPGFFRVQEHIEISGRTYAGVGNTLLLQAETFATVHVRHELTDAAARCWPCRPQASSTTLT